MVIDGGFLKSSLDLKEATLVQNWAITMIWRLKIPLWADDFLTLNSKWARVTSEKEMRVPFKTRMMVTLKKILNLQEITSILPISRPISKIRLTMGSEACLAQIKIELIIIIRWLQSLAQIRTNGSFSTHLVYRWRWKTNKWSLQFPHRQEPGTTQSTGALLTNPSSWTKRSAMWPLIYFISQWRPIWDLCNSIRHSSLR